MTNVIYDCRGMITGTLLDCLDLYVYCMMNDIPLQFSLLNTNNKALETIKILHSLYEERGYNYYISEKILDDIRVISKVDILTMDKVIFFDYASVKECLLFLKNVTVLFVSNLLMNEDISLIYSLKERKNIKTIGESRYNFFVEEEYRQKFLVPIIKERKRKTLVVCPGISFDDIQKYHSGNLENVILRNQSTYNNLWGNFDRLIYLQSPVIYDRKPRILYECYKCNIPIEYHRYGDKIDGSYFRYNDYEDREYKIDDYLIEWIRNE